MSASASRPRLRVGDWLLDTTSFEIERDGRRERLPHRLGRLLARLAQEPGQVVPHGVLLTEVWQRAHVDADLLARAVAELRRALGDDPRAPRYIETIPKSGYRLVAPVTHIEPASGAATPLARAAPGRRALLAGVAVLLAAAGVAVWRHGASPRLPAPAPFARERPLTSAPGLEIGPALSVDGQLVAYAEARERGALPQLVVQAIDGLGQRRFEEPAAHYAVRPVFSPDGRQLAYLRRGEGVCELHVRPLLAGESSRLAACAADVSSSADWARDGSALVYTAPAEPGHGPGIAWYELATGSVQRLTAPSPEDGADTDPRLAPDGRTLAFVRGADSHRRVLLASLDAPHHPRALAIDPSRVSGLAWTPHGDALIVASDALGYRALLRVDPARGVARLFGARGGQFPAFAANGDLVYELASYDANIWRLELARAGAEPSAVVRSTRYDGTPVFAPDGTRFAYVSTRDDQESVRIAALDGSDDRRLPLDPAPRWVMPAWSPDGRALLLSRHEGQRTSVHRHELASGRTTPLDALGEHAFAAQYLDDGSAIVYARRDAAAHKSLWLIASALDAPARPLAPGVPIDRFQAGAGVIVYSTPNQPGLVALPLDGGASHTVLPQLGPEARFNWCLTATTIWFVADDGGERILRRHEIDTGTTHDVARGIDPGAGAPALSVAPDGRNVVYARIDHVSIDLMLAPGAVRPARAAKRP